MNRMDLQVTFYASICSLVTHRARKETTALNENRCEGDPFSMTTCWDNVPGRLCIRVKLGSCFSGHPLKLGTQSARRLNSSLSGLFQSRWHCCVRFRVRLLALACQVGRQARPLLKKLTSNSRGSVVAPPSTWLLWLPSSWIVRPDRPSKEAIPRKVWQKCKAPRRQHTSHAGSLPSLELEFATSQLPHLLPHGLMACSHCADH